MEVENKKTALSDDAALYRHETDSLTEKEKLKGMKGSQKWQYFKQYYLLKLLLALAGVGILAAILISVFKPKQDSVMYACVFDYCVSRDTVDRIQEEFSQYVELDTEKYTTTFDMNFLYDGLYSEGTQRFAMLSGVGTVSLSIMPESDFKVFAERKYFEDLEWLFDDKVLAEEYRSLLVYAYEIDEKGNEIEGSRGAYGIRIDSCPQLQDNSWNEPIIFTINKGKKDDKYAKEFLRFLFANK